MKKFALSLMIASAAVFGLGAVASAQYGTIPTTTTTTTTTTTIPATTTEAGSGVVVPPSTAAPTTTAAATTPPAGLPATGSDGVTTMSLIAIGLLAVGFGLFVATRARRGEPNAT